MTALRIEPQHESYQSTLTTRHLHLHRGRCEQLAQGCYLVVHRLGIKPWTFRSRIQRPNRRGTKTSCNWFPCYGALEIVSVIIIITSQSAKLKRLQPIHNVLSCQDLVQRDV